MQYLITSFHLAFFLILMINLAFSKKAIVSKYNSGECKIGEFHKSEEFYDGDVLENILENHSDRFLAKELYCGGAELFDVVVPESGEAVCECDCGYAHGASGGGRLECDKRASAACRCKYNEWDKDFIHKCTHSDWGKGINSTEKCGNDEEAEGNELITSSCQPIFEGAIKLVCQGFDEVPPNPVSQAGNILVFPEDLCAIDCYLFHGSETPPHGFCAISCGTPTCYCL